MSVVNRFNVNNTPVKLNADIIENMSANDVSYESSFQYDENTVGSKLLELESKTDQQGIYDVSAHNNGAVFESLSDLLNNINLDTLIPLSVRKGGMSIRFIQGSVTNSDNKYVQYRLMSDTFNTTESNWQGVDDEPTVGSENLVKSGGIKNYVDNQLTLKQNSLKNLSETTTTSADEEQVWGSDDLSEDYAKIGSYGVKAKSYLDIDGNDAVMPYINKIKHKNARFIFLGDLHYSGKDGHLDDEVPEENLPSSMSEGHSIRYRFQHLIDALNAEHHKRPIDLVICTGDVIEGNSYESFIKEFVWQLQMPIVFSPGNHDAMAESYWIKYFGNRWQFGVETDDFVFVNWDNWNHIDITSGIVIPTYEQIYNRINTACATGKLVISFSHSEGGDMRNNLIDVARLFPNYVAHVSGHIHSMKFLNYGTFKVINDGNFAFNGDGNYSLNDVRRLFGFNNIEVEDGKLKSWFIWPEYNYRKANFTMPFSEGTLVNDGDNYVVGSGLKYEMRSVSCESDDNLIQLYKLKDLYLKTKISINENR